MEQAAKLITVLVPLFAVVSWPLLGLFVILYLGRPLKKFLANVGELGFKAGTSGVEVTAKRLEVAANLGAATAKASNTSSEQPGLGQEQGRKIADVVSQSVQQNTIRKLAGATVLWVDDNPQNNVYERRALEAIGIRFTISKSTADALEKLRRDRYDVIISDMGRPPDSRAGYTLLQEIRKSGGKTPFIIYAGSRLPEHIAEAQRMGAIGTTNDPQELFQLVLTSIEREA